MYSHTFSTPCIFTLTSLAPQIAIHNGVKAFLKLHLNFCYFYNHGNKCKKTVCKLYIQNVLQLYSITTELILTSINIVKPNFTTFIHFVWILLRILEVPGKTVLQSNLAIRNGFIRNKLVLRNHFL